MKLAGFAAAVALLAPAALAAQDSPEVQANPPGTVTVPGYELPLSDEARALLEAGTTSPMGDGPPPPPEAYPGIRAGMRAGMAPQVEALRAEYGVTIEEAHVGGIHGYWVRPGGEPAAAPRPVLLNLPAGAFLIGQANPIGLIEAIPVAALGGFDIFTMDYRQAPEHTFPAASEDVAAAYAALLTNTPAGRIGIYGCSAGGLLTAQALAWFDAHDLPMPGAAGILCASADGLWGGDSWHWQNPLQGSSAAPAVAEEMYYGGHDPEDPLLSPDRSPELLAKFPPSLLISATRAGELSSTVNTHRLLVHAGVEAELHVWDGFGHAFMFLNPQLPESKEVFAVIAAFFEEHLSEGIAE